MSRMVTVAVWLLTLMLGNIYANDYVNTGNGSVSFSKNLMVAQSRSLSLPININYSSSIKRGTDYELVRDTSWVAQKRYYLLQHQCIW